MVRAKSNGILGIVEHGIDTSSPSLDGDSGSSMRYGRRQRLRKGPWTSSEDSILREYVNRHGDGDWSAVKRKTALHRGGKSCRLRWMNYVRPTLNTDIFSYDEVKLIVALHAKLGNKWAHIAEYLPGRSDNKIKNFWMGRVKRFRRAGLPFYPPDIGYQLPPRVFMQKEIREQNHSVMMTMRGKLKDGSVWLEGFNEFMETIRSSRRIILIGCDTSFHAALAVRPFMEELTDIPVTVVIASDMVDRRALVSKQDTAIFVSRSGETADTLLALDYALERGALCIGVTNNVRSTLARKTHCGVHLSSCREIGVACTKAYTSQIVVMVLMALTVGSDNMSTIARREATILELSQLPSKIEEVLTLELDDGMKRLADSLIDEQSLLMIGCGYNYATALEGALKVQEVSLMHSEGMLIGGMKLGPLARVDENLPIVVIDTHGDFSSKQEGLIRQICSREGNLIVMHCEGDESLICRDEFSTVIQVPRVIDCLQPVINIIPLQLLAYHLSVSRGYDAGRLSQPI